VTVLPALPAADLCPICGHNHAALDEFWACPRHGHQLQYATTTSDRERYNCPALGCAYHRWAPRKPRTPSKGDPMTTVATRPSTAVDAMWNRKPHLEAILPAHIDVKAFIGTAAAALYSSADLMKAAEASPDTLITALMRCASLGHQPGTEEFYLTPRKDHGRPTVLGIEGYRGIVERMYRSGAVASVVVREVCMNDFFSYTEGRDDKPVHSFGGHGGTGGDFFGKDGAHDRGPMVGVYAYATLTTGAVSRVVLLNRSDVEAARDTGGYRPNDPYSPWNRYDAGRDHPEFQGRSMWWKTAARRLEPWVPTSAEYRREQLRAAAAAAQTPPPASAGWLPSPAEMNDITDAELVDTGPARATTGQLSMLGSLFRGMGFDDGGAEETLSILATFAGLDELNEPAALTQDQAGVAIGHLKACKGNRGALIELLAEAAGG
jgi:recombination protein RecT